MEDVKNISKSQLDIELFIALTEVDKKFWYKLIDYTVVTIWGEGIIKEVIIDTSVKFRVLFQDKDKTKEKLLDKIAINRSIYKIIGDNSWLNIYSMKKLYNLYNIKLQNLTNEKSKLKSKKTNQLQEVELLKRKIKSYREPYINHCFKCGDLITEELERCYTCGWYICKKCQSCGCNYYGHCNYLYYNIQEKLCNTRINSISNEIEHLQKSLDEIEVMHKAMSYLVQQLKIRIYK